MTDQPKPRQTHAEFRQMVEDQIKEMGLTGEEATAFRQKHRMDMYSDDELDRSDKLTKQLTDEEASALAEKVGNELGLDVETLKKRMGLTK
jgi:hypothetical protein